MAIQTVSVERHVEQVIDGHRYKGYLKIADSRFDYELKFGFPIRELHSLEPTRDDNVFRHRFQITLKRGDTDIELTREEYAFFFTLIVEFVMQFYELDQTRDANEGGLGAIIRGEGMFSIDGVSASISMTSDASCGFSSTVCRMLSAPKFGCVLASA